MVRGSPRQTCSEIDILAALKDGDSWWRSCGTGQRFTHPPPGGPGTWHQVPARAVGAAWPAGPVLDVDRRVPVRVVRVPARGAGEHPAATGPGAAVPCTARGAVLRGERGRDQPPPRSGSAAAPRRPGRQSAGDLPARGRRLATGQQPHGRVVPGACGSSSRNGPGTINGRGGRGTGRVSSGLSGAPPICVCSRASSSSVSPDRLASVRLHHQPGSRRTGGHLGSLLV
jgi:hypothetical protein